MSRFSSALTSPGGQFESIRLSDNPFERLNLGFERLIRLDPGGASRALFRPEELSPAERRSLVDEFGLDGGNDLFRRILNVASNPLVLIGAVLAMRYPVPLARNMFKVAPKVLRQIRNPGIAPGLLRDPGFLRTQVFGNIDDIYRGVPAGRIDELGDVDLPERIKIAIRDIGNFKSEHANRVGASILKWQSRTGQQFDEAHEILLNAKLQGLDKHGLTRKTAPIFKEINLGKPFDDLVREVRGEFDKMWDMTFAKAEKAAELNALQRLKVSKSRFRQLQNAVSKGEKLSEADRHLIRQVASMKGASKRQMFDMLRAEGINLGDASEKIEDFAPRVLKSFPTEFARQERQELARQAALGFNERQFGRQMLGRVGEVTTPSALPRRNKMIPAVDQLRQVRQWLRDPEGTIGRLSQRVNQARQRGQTVPEFDMRFLDPFERYTHGVSKAFGWTVRGHGPEVQRAVQAMEETASLNPVNKVRAAMMRDSFIPLALGQQTYKQGLWSAQWASIKLGLAEQLQQGSALKKTLGPEWTNWFTERLTEDRGIFSLRNISGKLASVFYAGALGANPVPAGWNMMQTLLTTVPVIGPQATTQGLKRVLKRVPDYMRQRQKGVGHVEALQRVFKEFGEEGLAGAPLVQEAIGSGLNDAWQMASRGPVRRGIDKVNAGLMAFFTASENTVRLTAFEGSFAKALREGLSKPQAAEFARRVTETTQFLGGMQAVPALLRNAGPLLRQFGTFPLRTMGFMLGPGTELGAAAKSGLGFGLAPGRNFGTLGRAMLTSGLGYEAAQEFLNQDVSRGLLLGALPTPFPGQPFSPVPFLPPVLSIAGSAAQGVFSGDFGNLIRQLPIAVPGGQALSRVATVGFGLSGEPIGRGFAAYEQRLPDGRIPVFTSQGSLRGFLTPMELWMRALGVPPSGPRALQRERELVDFLVGNTERIRRFRREYVDALVIENDVRKAHQVQEDYKRAYPGLGGIQIDESHLRAVRLRQTIPRLERLLENAPADVRPQLGALIGTTLINEAQTLLNVDPMLLAIPGGTIRSRDFWREPPQQSIMQELFLRDVERKRQLMPFGRNSSQTTQFGGIARLPGLTQQSERRPPRTLPTAASQAGFGAFSNF